MVTTMDKLPSDGKGRVTTQRPREVSLLSNNRALAADRRRDSSSSTSSSSSSAWSSVQSRSSSDNDSLGSSTLSLSSSDTPSARNSTDVFEHNMAPTRRGILHDLRRRFRKGRAAKPADEPSPFLTAPPTRRPDRPGMNPFTTAPYEPPPAYTPGNATLALPPYTPSPLSTPNRSSTASTSSTTDDPYSFLGVFDTIFLIDDSGSMAGRSWHETGAALEALTPILVAHDDDGIDVHFLNAKSQPRFSNVRDAATMHDIFNQVRPCAGTPTGMRLNDILKAYLRRYEASPETTKPLNVIVITDGVPSDDVESVVITAAKKLDALDADLWQVGIQFFQVGQENGAREHLESLDDELSRLGGGCRDIVDTVPFKAGPRGRGMGLSAEGILKVVLGAVNRRLDRTRNSGEQARA